MRDVYYQPTGNPLQLDRLPSVSSSVQLMAERHHPNAWKSPLWIFSSAAVVLVFTLVHLCTDALSALGSLLIVKMISMPLIMIIMVRMLVDHFDLKKIHRPLVVGLIMLLMLNLDVPLPIRQLLLAVVLGLLTFQLGMHAIAILTAPPVEPKFARLLQQSCQRIIMESSIIAGGVSLALMWYGSGLVMWLTLSGRLIWVLVTTFRTRKGIWLRLCGLLHSWFCYDAGRIVGLLQSPAGPQISRGFLGLLASLLMLQVSILQRMSPLPVVFMAGKSLHESFEPTAREAPDAGYLLHHFNFAWLLATFFVIGFYFIWPYLIAVLVILPRIAETAQHCEEQRCATITESVQIALKMSSHAIDQQSIFLGRILSDGSPVLLPRSLFAEHAHGLGDSGSGKTSLFLCPIIEQLVNGDCSVLVLDLKADSLELLSTLQAANDKLAAAGRSRMPLKYFSNQPDCPTFAFNPMTQSFWDRLDRQTQTDIMCSANGLNYGDNYGAGYYSSANAAVLQQAWRMFPDIRTFRELADKLGDVLVSAKKKELHPEIRRAGVHVHEVIKRLANVDPLNVASNTGHPKDVVEQTIDLTQPFQTPQLLYFHLSATLSPSGAPEIARLVTYMLLAAATKTERKHQVFLVIDEFQRIVANNLEYMLQLARSMGVGIILANQSMEDLRKAGSNLIPAIEANCRLRQWFSVSSQEDRERILRSSGETIDTTRSWSTTKTDTGINTSTAESEVVVPRITMNDLLLMSDHPFQSLFRVSRGLGQAQFGGFPVIIQSEHHISKDEYRRRCSMSWPDTVGAYVPKDYRKSTAPAEPRRTGPRFTEETIDGSSSSPSPEEVEEFFEDVERQFFGQPQPPRPKRGDL